MSGTLTPFQLWTLFLMFDNPSRRYTRRDLLLSCCDSAIKTLSTKTVDDDLSSLRSARYIEGNSFADIINDDTKYRISDEGILYVRKNLSRIQDACNKGAVPEPIISAQNDEIAGALRAKSPSLSELIVKHGIQNISNILKLFEACVAINL